jgi:hypothetical protein
MDSNADRADHCRLCRITCGHAVLLQGALPTPEEVTQKKQQAEARDKLAKALVGEVMDYDRNSPQLAAACVHTLLLMISNVLSDPGDERKRMVRVNVSSLRSFASCHARALAVCRHAVDSNGWHQM